MINLFIGDERKGWRLFEGHFFNLETDLDKEDTALTRMETHYNYSIECAKNNNWEVAIEELARALHYIQDMCCPVHIWGYDFNMCNLDTHYNLEKDWDAMWNSMDLIQYIPTGLRVTNNFKSVR